MIVYDQSVQYSVIPQQQHNSTPRSVSGDWPVSTARGASEQKIKCRFRLPIFFFWVSGHQTPNSHPALQVATPKRCACGRVIMLPVLSTFLLVLGTAMADSVTWSSACAPAGSGWRALQLRAGRQPDCLAWASFSDTIETLGWANLIVETNPTFDDQSQAYAAGWIEAALTRERIYQVCASSLCLAKK
jgi:hypothetical protein